MSGENYINSVPTSPSAFQQLTDWFRTYHVSVGKEAYFADGSLTKEEIIDLLDVQPQHSYSLQDLGALSRIVGANAFQQLDYMLAAHHFSLFADVSSACVRRKVSQDQNMPTSLPCTVTVRFSAPLSPNVRRIFSPCNLIGRSPAYTMWLWPPYNAMAWV
ncbi:MAG: hypothetical protein HYV02_00715 [Deltaproteobacteria bacterium]|nr:hypothetical protein [Deltaproteobacteria bacterium]